MSINTTIRTGAAEDQTERATRGVLIATALAGIPQLLLAAILVVATWVELDAMTPQQRSDSWAGLGYYIGALVAIPPALAGLLAVGAWPARRQGLGLALAIIGLCVVGVPALAYAGWLLDLASGW